MRIRSLTVAGAGKFERPVTIAGFGDGVNLLCEQNEAGKSTLFRALRTCLFERHSTSNEAVRNLACDGLALPVQVRLGFEHGGEDYVIEKSFLKQKNASLSRGGREVARMAEADEAVWELLGIRPGSGRAVDQAQFGLLWVSQGQSFERPTFSEAAASALGAAIHAEVGTLVGGERARMLLAEVEADLSAYVTGATRKAKRGGPWEQAQEEVAARLGPIAEAERKLAAMERQIEQLAQARRALAEAADPQARQEIAAERAALEAELAAATEARDRLALREPLAKAMRASCDEADRRVREIVERGARIDADRARLAALAESLGAIAEQEGAQARRLAEARAETEGLVRAEIEGEAALARLKDLSTLAAEAALAPDLAERRAVLAEAVGRLRSVDGRLALNRADEATVSALTALDRDIASVQALVEARATRVEIAIGPSGAGSVLVEGAAVVAGRVISAAEPVSIAVGDLATIRVVPPAGGAAELQRKQSLAAKRAALLAGAGFADSAALLLAGAERAALERDRLGVLGQLKGLGLDPARAEAGIEALDAKIAESERRIAAALAAAGREALPTSAALEAERSALEASRAAAREARSRIEGRREAANAQLQRLSSERGARQAERGELERRLALDVAQLPDDQRGAVQAQAEVAAAAARAALAAEEVALEALRRSTPDQARLEQLRNRAGRLKSVEEQRRQLIADKDREIAHLQGQIEAAGGEGLGEELAKLRDEAAFWRRQEAKHERRVRVLELLHDTVAACYDEQRERLHAPVKRHLKPYLEDVFALADPDFGDAYDVQRLARGGPSERFELLSAGTQEQIAVLTRLAMGSLLAERGQAVPIILDDALVYSDDERIERMFDALGRAAGQQQVVVFTCRQRAFQRLGGRRLTLSFDAA